MTTYPLVLQALAERERSPRRDRSRERRRRSRSPRDRRRSRSRDRRRSRSKDRRRRRSRSISKSKSRSRSRSKSPAGGTGYDPDRKRRRPTWFDIPPVGGAPPPISQLPGAVQVTPNMPSAPGGGSAVPVAGYAGAANQQATRHARRVYVGGLPPSAREENIATFFRQVFI